MDILVLLEHNARRSTVDGRNEAVSRATTNASLKRQACRISRTDRRARDNRYLGIVSLGVASNVRVVERGEGAQGRAYDIDKQADKRGCQTCAVLDKCSHLNIGDHRVAQSRSGAVVQEPAEEARRTKPELASRRHQRLPAQTCSRTHCTPDP